MPGENANVNTLQREFEKDLNQKWDVQRLKWRIEEYFRGIDWRGKSICEIGCGRGDLSIYMALNGARHVTALEPGGDGSNNRNVAIIQDRIQKYDIPNMSFYPILFEDYEAEPSSFDAVFSLNVIEHIHETSALLTKDPEAYKAYEVFFQKVFDCLKPGGYAIMTTCSRYSIYAYLSWLTNYRVKSFLSPSIRWELHQPPSIWRKMCDDIGYSPIHIRWRVPYPLRSAPWLGGNPVFQFFVLAEYIVVAQKPA